VDALKGFINGASILSAFICGIFIGASNWGMALIALICALMLRSGANKIK